MRKNLQKFLKLMSETIALTIVFSLFATMAVAQTVVTGKVTAVKNGIPLGGITVNVKGTQVGTQTSSDGTFTLTAPANATSLEFTSVGYTNKTVAIAANLNVRLDEISQQMNEIVVVSYGTRKKSDLTGAVTSISAKDFQKGNINSSEQLLQGKVAGLQITSGGGSAGGGSTIRIRGGASLNASNDPLIVIDGVPVEGNGISGNANVLNTINPNDIESMSVLKDASATALFGSRASNGVIVITTKKGIKGKVKYNFNSQYTVGVVGKTVDVLSAAEIRSIVTGSENAAYINLMGKGTTDWQKLIYQDAVGVDNNISASGAIGNIPFRASVGYLDQQGILKTDKFQRVSSSLNLSPKFFDNHLSVNMNLKLAQTKNRFADGGAVGSAASFDPTQDVNDANKFGGNFEWLNTIANVTSPKGIGGNAAAPNPLSMLNFRNNNSVTDRFIGNIQLDYKLHFLPDLHLLANLGTDRTQGKGDDITDSISVTNIITNGRFSHYAGIKSNNLIELSLFYTKDLKSIDSKMDFLAGHSYQDFLTNVYNFASYSLRGNQIPGTEPVFATDLPQFRLESYYTRLNYTLSNKYLLTASLRRDATSKFSKENRVGYFPSVALAWKMKEEFFKNTSKVSDLKLRLGWGITGNQDGIGNYDYITRYSISTNNQQYQFGNQFYSFLRPAAVDPGLRWETTTTSNIGLDYGFFNNRISGSIDVYQKTTKDLISRIPIAPGGNYNIELTTNVGNIENKGVEFTINTTPVKNEKFQWDFGFNATYNQTIITNLLKVQDIAFKGIEVGGISGGTGNNISKHVVGYSPNTFFVYKQIYDNATGRPIEGLYEDLNRDGKIDENDRYLHKKPAADVLFGINTQASYKNWSLGLAAHGSFANYIYNNYNSRTGVFNNILNGSVLVSNASSDYLNTGFINQQFLSDYYIENASFFRLDNINLGYNMGKVFRNTATLRVSASIQNVFVITKYSGLDPENSNGSGIDNTIYPRPRMFSLGANLDF